LDIYQLKVPVQSLRPVKDIPLLNGHAPGVWPYGKNLRHAYQQKSSLPLPPGIDQNLWPPSGMENLDASFKWAIGKTSGITADSWRFYYGTWLAGGEKQMKLLKYCR